MNARIIVVLIFVYLCNTLPLSANAFLTNRYQIDFGSNAYPSAGDVNNITSAASTTHPLKTKIGAYSGVEIAISNWEGVNTLGCNAPLPTLGIPTNATRDFIYKFTVNWPFGNGYLSLKKLKTNASYTIQIYASRNDTQSRECLYTIEGKGAAVSGLLDAGFTNKSNKLMFTNLEATSTGEIKITVSKGSLNIPSCVYVNWLEITEVYPQPPPVNALLLNLSSPYSSSYLVNQLSGTSGTLTALIDTNGNSTPISVTLQSSNGWFFNSHTATLNPVPTPSSSLNIEGGALNGWLHGDNTTTHARFIFSNLNPSLLYGIEIFATRNGVSDIREGRYTVTGAPGYSNSILLDAANNLYRSALISGIQPTTSGNIYLDIAKGPNNNQANGWFYINALRLDWTGGVVPKLNAGTNVSITASQAALSVTVENGISVTNWRWEQIGGPQNAIFQNASSSSTSIRLPVSGTYHFSVKGYGTNGRIGVAYKTITANTYLTHYNISYTTNADPYAQSQCKLDIYQPVSVTNASVFVHFHGGSLIAGDKSSESALGISFASDGVIVVSVNYRLHPNVFYPEFYRDAAEAFAWVKKNISSYGGNSNAIFIGGHSAGGNITCVLGTKKQFLAERGYDNVRDVAGYVPYSPQTYVHNTVAGELYGSATFGLERDEAPIASARIATNQFAPFLIYCAQSDMEWQTGHTNSTKPFWSYLDFAKDFYDTMTNGGRTNVEFQIAAGRTHGDMTSLMGTLNDPVRTNTIRFIRKWTPASYSITTNGLTNVSTNLSTNTTPISGTNLNDEIHLEVFKGRLSDFSQGPICLYKLPDEHIEDNFISITISDISGRAKVTLCNESLTESNQAVYWDGKDDRGNFLPTGAYLLKVTEQWGNFKNTRWKMFLIAN